MKNIGLYIYYYDLGTVALLVGLPLLLFLAIKRRMPPAWRLLFASEAVLLFISAANCLVPGTLRDFWISESVDYGLAFAVTVGSIAAAHRLGSTRAYWKTPQFIALFTVTALISLQLLFRPL
jgi:hypothetical protein